MKIYADDDVVAAAADDDNDNAHHMFCFFLNCSCKIWKNAQSGAREACCRPGRAQEDMYAETARVTYHGVPYPRSLSGQFQSLSTSNQLPLSSGITRCSNQSEYSELNGGWW